MAAAKAAKTVTAEAAKTDASDVTYTGMAVWVVVGGG